MMTFVHLDMDDGTKGKLLDSASFGAAVSRNKHTRSRVGYVCAASVESGLNGDIWEVESAFICAFRFDTHMPHGADVWVGLFDTDFSELYGGFVLSINCALFERGYAPVDAPDRSACFVIRKSASRVPNGPKCT